MSLRSVSSCLSLVLGLSLSTSTFAQSASLDSSSPSDSFDLDGALFGSGQGLTSDEAGTRARGRAPQIASAEASAVSADLDRSVQTPGLYPTVTLSAQYKRINYVPNNAFNDISASFAPGATLPKFPSFALPRDNYSFAATARWPVSDLYFRLWPALQASKHIADARKIDVEARVASAELTAREAFYAYARATATMLVADQALKQAEAQASQAKLFVDAGTAAPVDYLTAKARVESMRSALARSRGTLAVTRNTLAVLMGVPRDQVNGIREPVTMLPEAPKQSDEELLRIGLERRPELRAIRKMIGAGEEQVSAERGGALPVLSVEGTALEANPNPRYVPPVARFRGSWEVGGTLSWTPNASVVGYQRTQRAKSELNKSRADLIALEDGVRTEVVQSYEDYKAASAAAEASQAQQDAAEETYRVRLATYRVGAGVQIDLLTADLALTQARLDRVNAAIDARIALARLARATGQSAH